MEDKNEVMRDRFRGTLLGLAVGDALGAPAEFMTAEQIREKYGTLSEMVGGGWMNLKPGEYTDDTTMMLCIAESLVANQGYNPDDIAQRFVAWLRSNPKGIGNTTRRALQRIADGVSWQEAGDKNGVANGSVMRCAPIGLMFAFDLKALELVSRETSAITHANNLAILSCVFINNMIAGLVRGVEGVREEINALNFEADYLERTGRYISPGSGLAVDTMCLAFRSFTKAATFEEAVVRAVNLGGDTDTIGAVTGALAGAHWGVSAIPERWYSKLNPYSASKIIGLADALFDLAIYLK